MMKNTRRTKKSFSLYGWLSAIVVAVTAALTVIVSVAPAAAAQVAPAIDTEVAIFVVPLALLLVAMIFEAARVAIMGRLPVESLRRARVVRHWEDDRASR